MDRHKIKPHLSCALYAVGIRFDTELPGSPALQLTDDEDAVMEEEEEALRLQREAMEGLRPEDYGEDDKEDDDDDDDEDDEEEGEETMKDKAMKVCCSRPHEFL